MRAAFLYYIKYSLVPAVKSATLLRFQIQRTDLLSNLQNHGWADRKLIKSHTKEGLGQRGICPKFSTDTNPAATLVTIVYNHLQHL